MKSFRISLALLLAVAIINTINAQSTPVKHPAQGATAGAQAGGVGTITGDNLEQLQQLLQDGSLIHILSNPDLAKALGLNFEQWMLAGYLIDEYQNAVMYFWLIDPQGQDPATWQTLSVIQALLELQLYQLLTPEQQQLIDQIFSQLPATPGATTASGSPVKGSGK
jgi:hypothetical protein